MKTSRHLRLHPRRESHQEACSAARRRAARRNEADSRSGFQSWWKRSRRFLVERVKQLELHPARSIVSVGLTLLKPGAQAGQRRRERRGALLAAFVSQLISISSRNQSIKLREHLEQRSSKNMPRLSWK